MDSPFSRVPTNEEKMFYRKQWGGISPHKAAVGIALAFAIGLLLGLALS